MLHEEARHTCRLALEEATKYRIINFLPPSEGDERIKLMQLIWRTRYNNCVGRLTDITN